MKNIKMSFIATITVLAIVSACEKDNSIKDVLDDESINTLAGTWKVISYDDVANNTQIIKNADNTWPDNNNGDVIITFKDTVPTGQFHGITVTNEVYGNYTLSNPRKIHIENFWGTKMNQPDWADLFWEGIRKSEEYSVNSKQLRIFYNSGKNSITFDKE
jgi:hypothetical protein